MSELRILQLIPSLAKGGAERMVLNICNELRRYPDVEVLLVVLHPENDYQEESSALNVVVCTASVQPSITGKWHIHTKDYEAIIKDFKPHIIHSHLFEAELLSRYKTHPDIQYFSHFHGNMPQLAPFSILALMRSPKASLIALYEKNKMISLYNRAMNHFIAVSEDTRAYIRKALPPGLSQHLSLLPNAINLERFSGETRKKTGKPLQLLAVGSLLANKNHTFLIKVAKRLKETNTHFILKIAGEGPERKNLQRQIDEEDLLQYIQLPGAVNRIENLYREADILLHTALYESFGLVLVEAMACGLPVICLDGKGNRDIVENGKNGFILSDSNAELFTEKILLLAKDSRLYAEMSTNAMLAAHQYDIRLYVEKLIALYRSKLPVKTAHNSSLH